VKWNPDLEKSQVISLDVAAIERDARRRRHYGEAFESADGASSAQT
jgi:hypothetical protein